MTNDPEVIHHNIESLVDSLNDDHDLWDSCEELFADDNRFLDFL